MIHGRRTHRPRTRIVPNNVLPLALLMLFSTVPVAHAQFHPQRPLAPPVPTTPGLARKNALGGQLGPWFSQELSKEVIGQDYRISANATAFHLELFYQPRLTAAINLDINVGAVGRGDLRISNETEEAFGTATLYPIGFGIRIAPFARHADWPIQPILRVGGSLIIGTERLQSAVSNTFGTFIGESSQSRVAPGFYGGGGLIWLLGDKFALTGGIKYQQARFSKEIFGSKDYSGVQVLFGAMYLYP